MTDRNKLIDRGLGERLLDLRSSLLLIRDVIDEIRKGKPHFIIPLYSQLRSLLIEKRRDNEALLLYLADRLEVDVPIFWLPLLPEEFKKETGVDPAMMAGGFPMGLKKELPSQKVTTIKKVLKEKIIYLNEDVRYSLEQMIKICAEKAGGAHWAKRLTVEQRDLLSLNVIGMRPVHSSIIQFAEVVFQFGKVVLSKLVTNHIHLFALLPDLEIRNPTMLFWYGYPNKQNFIRLIITPRFGFIIELRAFNGESQRLQCAPEFSKMEMCHFEIANQLNDKLQSILSVRIDGAQCGESKRDQPPLFDGRANLMEGKVNFPSKENENQFGMQFALSQLLIRGESMDDYARERLEAYYRSTGFYPGLQVISFEPESRGICPAGSQNWIFENTSSTELNSYIRNLR